jgi:hypothetical protein
LRHANTGCWLHSMRGSGPLLDDIAHPRLSSTYADTSRPRLMVCVFSLLYIYGNLTNLVFRVFIHTTTSFLPRQSSMMRMCLLLFRFHNWKERMCRRELGKFPSYNSVLTLVTDGIKVYPSQRRYFSRVYLFGDFSLTPHTHLYDLFLSHLYLISISSSCPLYQLSFSHLFLFCSFSLKIFSCR